MLCVCAARAGVCAVDVCGVGARFSPCACVHESVADRSGAAPPLMQQMPSLSARVGLQISRSVAHRHIDTHTHTSRHTCTHIKYTNRFFSSVDCRSVQKDKYENRKRVVIEIMEEALRGFVPCFFGNKGTAKPRRQNVCFSITIHLSPDLKCIN